MKNLLSIALIGMALVLFSKGALGVQVRGVPSCGVWIEDQDKAKARKEINFWSTWVVGYLSGLAVATNKDFWGKRGVDSLDNESVFLWIDNYCRANPLKSLDDAGVELFIERTRKK